MRSKFFLFSDNLKPSFSIDSDESVDGILAVSIMYESLFRQFSVTSESWKVKQEFLEAFFKIRFGLRILQI